MSTIWLDVTTTLGWRRAAVGVVRTETECAAHGLRQIESAQAPIRFCCFDRALGYREVAPSLVRDALALIAQPVVVSAAPEVRDWPAPGQRGGRALVLRLINRLPATMQCAVFRFAQRHREAFRALLCAYRELRQAFRLLRRPAHGAIVALPPQLKRDRAVDCPSTPFAAGDVYLSMGLDWDQKDLAYLYAQKRALGFKAILFCYDVIPVTLPHLCVGDVAAAFAHYFANVAWCADEVLCISECTRGDLRRLLDELGTPQPSLSVIKLGCQLPVGADEIVSSEVAEVLERPYILFVSTIERRKNHETLYRAYTRLLDRGETNLPQLVFVGMPGWGVQDLMADLRFDYRTKPLIRMLNNVSDADLARLYSHALFTVFPSLYEGWGLPVAESLAAGKFCLASSAASIPEVGGELVEYVDPWDVPAWAERLHWYITRPDVVAQKEAAIRQHYRPTSWTTCADDILRRAVCRMQSIEP